MGCFLGCFGFSCSKRKRRKPPNFGVIPADQRHSSYDYEPLNSSSTNLNITVAHLNSDSELSKKPKETLNCKIKKKVSFNLNVKTYEPILSEESADLLTESDHEEKKKQESSKETAKDGSLAVVKMASFPANYRYQNCIDEDDEVAYEESDLEYDEEEDDYDEDDSDGDDWRSSKEEFSGQLDLSAKRDSLTQLGQGKVKDLGPHGDSNVVVKSLGMNENARYRSGYVHSVLNPIENISQWKAVKVRGIKPVKSQSKENIASEEQQQLKVLSSASNFIKSMPLVQETAVDASLSNWLICPVSYQSRTPFIAKNGHSAVENMGSKKSLFDRTNSWRNREDITNLEI